MMHKPFLKETLLAAALLLAAPLPALAQMPEQQHQSQPGSGAAPQQDPSPAQPSPGMMGPGMTQAMPGQGMMGQGTPGQGTPGQGMMGQGTPGQAMPGQGMMGPGMMQAMPGQGMMGPGMGMGTTDCPMMAQMMRMHPQMMTMMHGHMGKHHGGKSYMGRSYMGRDHGDGHGGAGSGMMMGPQGGNLAAGVVEPMQHLSVDDVRHFFEHRLAQIGNARLKVGKVELDGEDSIVAEIVTQDDSLVDRLEVDRHSGEISRKP